MEKPLVRQIRIFSVAILTMATILMASIIPIPAVFATEYQFFPVDDGAGDPEFKTFRSRLIEATKHRDKEYLIQCLHPQIKVGLNGSRGPAEFIKTFKLDTSPEKSIVWSLLENTLTKGGRFLAADGKPGKTYFIAPYPVTKNPPLPTDDVYATGVITASDVNLRKEPNIDAPVTETLTYDWIVLDKSTKASDHPGWTHVKTLDGSLSGYVSSKFVHINGNRISFVKDKNGRWKMRSFIGGY